MAELIKDMSLNEQIQRLVTLGQSDIEWKDYDRHLLKRTSAEDNKGGNR